MDLGIVELIVVGVVFLFTLLLWKQQQQISRLERQLWSPFDCPWCDGTGYTSRFYHDGAWEGVTACPHCYLGSLYRGPDGGISNRPGPPDHPVTLPKWATDHSKRPGKATRGK